MFWQFKFATSTVNAILEKEEFTLEELLDDEEIIQECKTKNSKLLEFLSKDDIFNKLLSYIVDEPDANLPEKQRFKYPNLACEVLSSDVGFEPKLCDHEQMQRLLLILERPAPLNPLQASFLLRIFSAILARCATQFVTYLQEHDSIIDRLLFHIQTPAISDTLLRITTAPENKAWPIQQWLQESKNCISVLVDKFQPSANANDAELFNISQYFGDIINHARREFIEMQEYATTGAFYAAIRDSTLLGKLVDSCLQGGARLMTPGLQVILALVDEPARGEEDSSPSSLDAERHRLEIQAVADAFLPRLAQLCSVITPVVKKEESSDNAPLLIGQLRLKAIHILQVLIGTKTPSIDEELARLNILSSLLDMLSLFPINSFLHGYVKDILISIIPVPINIDQSEVTLITTPIPNTLYPHLIQQYNLLQRIMQLTTQTPPPPFSPHLFIVADALAKLSAKQNDPLTFEFPSLDADAKASLINQWNQFVAGPLERNNQRCNVTLGGEKPTANVFDNESEDDGSMIGSHAFLGMSSQLNSLTKNGFPEFNCDDDDKESGDNDATEFWNDLHEPNTHGSHVTSHQQSWLNAHKSDSDDEDDVWQSRTIEDATVIIPNPIRRNSNDSTSSTSSSNDSKESDEGADPEDENIQKSASYELPKREEATITAAAVSFDPFNLTTSSSTDSSGGWASFEDPVASAQPIETQNSAEFEDVAVTDA